MTSPPVMHPDKLHYLRIPDARGGRAEMVRMCYVLAGRAWEDVLHPLSDAATAVAGKNPYKQYPFVETSSGGVVVQTLAIMHHAAHGTPAWPSDPGRLTVALEYAMGGYDLYEAFGGFAADDAVGRKKFEERRAPQLLGALAELYQRRDFSTLTVPSFADCITHAAITWCVARNEVARGIHEASPPLGWFVKRFEALPAVKAFMERQAAAREQDSSV